MPISRKNAARALEVLVDRGLLTPEASKKYAEMSRKGVSYKRLMIDELGPVTGALYVLEEQAQHRILHGLDVNLSRLSVPEVLLLEDDPALEPWHRERYSESDTETKFRAESAEPWHPCLRDRFKPLPEVFLYFRERVEQYREARLAILRTVYRELEGRGYIW